MTINFLLGEGRRGKWYFSQNRGHETISTTHFVFLTIGVSAHFTYGQDSQGSIGAKPLAKLTEAQWKAVEGHFQSEKNKNLYLQFVAHDSILLIKYSWFQRVDTLRPVSDTAFISKGDNDQRYRQVFIKDPGGRVNKFVMGTDTWEKIENYKPVVIREMPHTPAQLKRFEGIYHSQGDTNNLFQFTVMDNDLVLKGNPDIHFVPESEPSFYKPDNLWFSMDFTEDAAGNITQALSVKRDVMIKNPKPSITAAQLYSYEGKYVAKNDSHNSGMVNLLFSHPWLTYTFTTKLNPIRCNW
jgi:hypothetical protein